VLFQPHRYTRTQHLWEDFCRAFNHADVLVLTDIYAASERPIDGITAEALANAIRAAGHNNVVYCRTLQDATAYLLGEARSGDAVLAIGAGNVNRALGELAVLLANHPASGAPVASPDGTPGGSSVKLP
jgi:UDP-N-acetylmuramate--alanine ligase